jgi:hypothetical protein
VLKASTTQLRFLEPSHVRPPLKPHHTITPVHSQKPDNLRTTAFLTELGKMPAASTKFANRPELLRCLAKEVHATCIPFFRLFRFLKVFADPVIPDPQPKTAG